jgi:hypothetical protein
MPRFCWHDWSGWGKLIEIPIPVEGPFRMESTMVFVQRRVCHRCEKVQSRRVDR